MAEAEILRQFKTEHSVNGKYVNIVENLQFFAKGHYSLNFKLLKIKKIRDEQLIPGESIEFFFEVEFEFGVFKHILAGLPKIKQVIQLTQKIKERLKKQELLNNKRLNAYKEFTFCTKELDFVKPVGSKLVFTRQNVRMTVPAGELKNVLVCEPQLMENKSKYFLFLFADIILKLIEDSDKSFLGDIKLNGFEFVCQPKVEGEFDLRVLKAICKEMTKNVLVPNLVSGLQDESKIIVSVDGKVFEVNEEEKERFKWQNKLLLQELTKLNRLREENGLCTFSRRSSIGSRGSLRSFSSEKVRSNLRSSAPRVKWHSPAEYKAYIKRTTNRFESNIFKNFKQYDNEVKYGLRDSNSVKTVKFRFDSSQIKY